MKKFYHLNGEKVRILKELELPQPFVKGKAIPGKPIIDQDGQWFQVEFVSGPHKGNRKPAAQKFLT